jgi:hypothetical protein
MLIASSMDAAYCLKRSRKALPLVASKAKPPFLAPFEIIRQTEIIRQEIIRQTEEIIRQEIIRRRLFVRRDWYFSGSLVVLLAFFGDEPFSGTSLFRGRTGFPLMSVAYTLALTQDRASHLWMPKPLPTRVNWASVALGEIPSVPEKPRNLNRPSKSWETYPR